VYRVIVADVIAVLEDCAAMLGMSRDHVALTEQGMASERSTTE
jgi:hypothetical protein